MNEEKERDQITDDALDEVAGGSTQNVAPCKCPYCGHWVVPELLYDRLLFCPDCGMQMGGVMG